MTCALEDVEIQKIEATTAKIVILCIMNFSQGDNGLRKKPQQCANVRWKTGNREAIDERIASKTMIDRELKNRWIKCRRARREEAGTRPAQVRRLAEN